MKEISYKELRNLPFGTKIRETSVLSDKVHDGVIANGKIIYENGSACDLEHIEYSEDISYANSGYSIIKFYILEDIHELMWKELKKKVGNDRDYYGSSRSVYSCSDYDERKHRMSTLNDVMAIMSSIEKSHE